MKTQINGHPVYVEYIYTPGLPFRQTGWGAGDCEPEEPDEVEIRSICDDKGNNITKWITDPDWYRIMDECIAHKQGRRIAA